MLLLQDDSWKLVRVGVLLHHGVGILVGAASDHHVCLLAEHAVVVDRGVLLQLVLAELGLDLRGLGVRIGCLHLSRS